MAMTAANTQPVQTAQMPTPATADILMRKRKKKPEMASSDPRGNNEAQSGPSTADILMRRKK